MTTPSTPTSTAPAAAPADAGGAPGLLVASTVEVAVPAEVAAATVLDWGQDPHWRPAVHRITLRPDGVATVGQEVLEELRFAGLTFRTPTRVVAVAPGHAAYEGTGTAVSVSGSRTVTPTGPASCRVDTALRVRGRGPMRPLVRALLASYRRSDAADLRRLAALLEARRPAAEPA